MHQRANRYMLGALLSFLAGSAFSSYFVPGLILIAVVGGSAALAAVAVLARHQRGFDLARIAGWILVAWLITQLAIAGFVSWLQPAAAAAAIAILWLAHRPRRFRPAWRTS